MSVNDVRIMHGQDPGPRSQSGVLSVSRTEGSRKRLTPLSDVFFFVHRRDDLESKGLECHFITVHPDYFVHDTPSCSTVVVGHWEIRRLNYTLESFLGSEET